jgi:hypothetical protein
MKLIYLLAIAFVLTLAACSDDDDTNPATSGKFKQTTKEYRYNHTINNWNEEKLEGQGFNIVNTGIDFRKATYQYHFGKNFEPYFFTTSSSEFGLEEQQWTSEDGDSSHSFFTYKDGYLYEQKKFTNNNENGFNYYYLIQENSKLVSQELRDPTAKVLIKSVYSYTGNYIDKEFLLDNNNIDTTEYTEYIRDDNGYVQTIKEYEKINGKFVQYRIVNYKYFTSNLVSLITSVDQWNTIITNFEYDSKGRYLVVDRGTSKYTFEYYSNGLLKEIITYRENLPYAKKTYSMEKL